MTKLEEVARAIAAYTDPLNAARAAVQALWEPNETMISAGAAEAWHAEYDTSERAWQAMIDAILNEKP